MLAIGWRKTDMNEPVVTLRVFVCRVRAVQLHVQHQVTVCVPGLCVRLLLCKMSVYPSVQDSPGSMLLGSLDSTRDAR